MFCFNKYAARHNYESNVNHLLAIKAAISTDIVV